MELLIKEGKVKNNTTALVTGKLIVFAAPSGAGKTTIVRHLLNKFECLSFSVSATSRLPREHEQDGVDYYFLTVEEFRKRIDSGAFLEWEEVYPGMYYGTLLSDLEQRWKGGKHIIFDIDVKGALSIKSKFPEQTLTVFVRPPDESTLRERLRKRDTETEDSLDIRVNKASRELSYATQFDEVLVNNNLEDAFAEAEALVKQFLGIKVED